MVAGRHEGYMLSAEKMLLHTVSRPSPSNSPRLPTLFHQITVKPAHHTELSPPFHPSFLFHTHTRCLFAPNRRREETRHPPAQPPTLLPRVFLFCLACHCHVRKEKAGNEAARRVAVFWCRGRQCKAARQEGVAVKACGESTAAKV